MMTTPDCLEGAFITLLFDAFASPPPLPTCTRRSHFLPVAVISFPSILRAAILSYSKKNAQFRQTDNQQ
jgi:hypothetical protein